MRVRSGPLPGESETVEWKESLAEWREIIETAAAFATAQGGRIFVGVSPKGEIRGVQIGAKSIEDISNRIVQNTEPRTIPSIRSDRVGERETLLIQIAEATAKPVHAFGRPYRRSGKTNQRLSPDQAAGIYMASRGRTWDETILDHARMDDLDMDSVRTFVGVARRERKVDWRGRSAPIKVLRHLRLVRDGRLTVAAILLFGAEPQRHLVQSQVRCARFKHDDAERPLDFKLIEGNIFDQVEEILRFVRRNIAMAIDVKNGGPRRTETWQYPLEAVREAVVNAVCHRDYGSTGNVQVRVFDRGLEVWNPGLLPPGITIHDLKRSHESKPRNKLMATAFFLAGVIEQFGQGTQKMVRACRDAGLPDPEFEERGTSFVVRFQARGSAPAASKARSRPESATQSTTQSATQSTDPVERLLAVLLGGEMSAGTLRELLGIKHRPTFRANYLHPALEAGWIAHTIPDKPNSRLQKYRLTARGKRRATKR